jgi:hypothetical protein
MPVELVIAPEADLDVAAAYVWYEGRRAGLGEDFLSSVDACLGSSRRRPEMYPVVHEGYHRALVHGFPYAVFYKAYIAGDGHDLRRISYLSRPGQMAPAPPLTGCIRTHDHRASPGRPPVHVPVLSAREPTQVQGRNGRIPPCGKRRRFTKGRFAQPDYLLD